MAKWLGRTIVFTTTSNMWFSQYYMESYPYRLAARIKSDTNSYQRQELRYHAGAYMIRLLSVHHTEPEFVDSPWRSLPREYRVCITYTWKIFGCTVEGVTFSDEWIDQSEGAAFIQETYPWSPIVGK